MTHRSFLWILPLGVFVWAFPELMKQAWNDTKEEIDRTVVSNGVAFVLILVILAFVSCGQEPMPSQAPFGDLDPTTVLWYTQPADKWENALPVGNGRLGAMFFGVKIKLMMVTQI